MRLSAFAYRPDYRPVNGQFDGSLARQVVLHILVSRFGLIKGRVAAMMGRQRVQVNNAIKVINKRLEDPPEFEACYKRWADRTEELYFDKLSEVA